MLHFLKYQRPWKSFIVFLVVIYVLKNSWFLLACCKLFITSYMYNKTWLVGKPKPDRKSITLGVTDQSGIEFSVMVIGYPEPQYDLKNENGTTNIKMKVTFTRNAINNFTIHFNQTNVVQNDYGSYYLSINNTFGETMVMVNVIPQSKY